MSNEFYILLPVHNRREITRSFVKCLRVQSHTNFHLVLVDDGSTDGTANMVSDYIPALTVLRGKGNLWWAGGLQKGIDWLKERNVDDSSIVLFINDDVSFGPDYLASADAVMNNRQGLLLLSRFSCDDGSTVSETGAVADLRHLTFRVASEGEDINCLSTRGLFIRFGDINIIGDFHPRVLPHYFSDFEYTIRAVRKGMHCETTDRVFLCPNRDESGYRDFEGLGFFRFLKEYFSIKSVANPVYHSVFIILSVPWLWVLPNLVKIWFRSARMIVRQLFVR